MQILFNGRVYDVVPGMVFRMNGSGSFSDCVVLGFEGGTDYHGDHVLIKMVRPYAFASSTETICPTPLVGYELFKVSSQSLRDNFKVIGDKEPYINKV